MNIQLHTPEGLKEYLYIQNPAEYEAGKDSGEITVGKDIVYKNYLVTINEDYGMTVLDMIQMNVPNWSFQFTGGVDSNN